MQSPSNARISYLNEHAIADVMRFPETKMWNLPITHNKSSNRWKNVRHPLHAWCPQQPYQPSAACCTFFQMCCHTSHLTVLAMICSASGCSVLTCAS